MPPVGERSTVAAALPGYIEDIVLKTGLAESTIRRWLNRMRLADHKTVHIARWKRKNGGMAPYYVLGDGVDATKPKPHSQAQYSRKWRKHRREKKAERAAALAVTMAHAALAAKTPQTWASALGLGA